MTHVGILIGRDNGNELSPPSFLQVTLYFFWKNNKDLGYFNFCYNKLEIDWENLDFSKSYGINYNIKEIWIFW